MSVPWFLEMYRREDWWKDLVHDYLHWNEKKGLLYPYIIYKYGTMVSCNINFYCTLKNDIAWDACADCNTSIIFQSAIKIDIARNQSAVFVLYMPPVAMNENPTLVYLLLFSVDSFEFMHAFSQKTVPCLLCITHDCRMSNVCGCWCATFSVM